MLGTTPAAPPAVGDTSKNDATKDGSKGGETPKGEPAKANEAAPAEIAIKLPDGVVADKPLMDGFIALAKESGLKGESAQKIADLYVQAQASQAKAAEEAHAKQVAAWAEEVKADKQIGGASLDASMAVASRAVAQFGSPELKELLNSSGLGNHPALVRAFVKIGRAISEDSIAGAVGGGKAESSDESLLRGLYPNSPGLFTK
jgi:hypothetical protein